MKKPSRASSWSDSVLELIGPFSETSDARLRGNAVQALAALLSTSDANLAVRAEERLVRTLASEPGQSDLEWQRRFLPRALEALTRLPEEARVRIRDELIAALRSAKDLAQRAWTARLIIAASSGGEVLPSIGWARWWRLTFMAGRPTVGRTAWAVTWRIGLVAFGLALLAQAFSDELKVDAAAAGYRIMDLAVLICLALFFLECFSIPAQPPPPVHARLMDIAISALVFALLATVGTTMLVLGTDNVSRLPELPALLFRASPIALMQAGVLGALVGAAVRAMRWAASSSVIEPEGFESFIRPVTAFAVTTLVCIVIGRILQDPVFGGAACLVLAPAAAFASWLDLWLERVGPQLLPPPPPAADSPWALPWVLAVSGLAVMAMSYKGLQGKSVALRLQSTTMAFPEEFAKTGSSTVETQFGTPVRFQIGQAGQYRTRTQPPDAAIVVLTERGRKISSENDSVSLVPGKYFVCAAPSFQERTAGECGLAGERPILDILAVLMGDVRTSTAGSADHDAVKITLERDSKRSE